MIVGVRVAFVTSRQTHFARRCSAGARARRTMSPPLQSHCGGGSWSCGQVATGRSARRHSSMPSARRMAVWPCSASVRTADAPGRSERLVAVSLQGCRRSSVMIHERLGDGNLVDCQRDWPALDRPLMPPSSHRPDDSCLSRSCQSSTNRICSSPAMLSRGISLRRRLSRRTYCPGAMFPGAMPWPMGRPHLALRSLTGWWMFWNVAATSGWVSV